MGDAWTTIESDPGVFTELIEQIGVQGVQLEELYSLDAQSLAPLRPVFGLIFLFKWRKETDNRPVDKESVGTVFFANQVIQNACATQAILSVLLNCPQLELGAELGQFKEFTADFPPDLKGLAIGNSDAIRGAHNSFARPEPIVSDESIKGGKDDDAFHFISYVPVNGMLYELDGLKEGPIPLGACTDDSWLELAGQLIQQRIDRYATSEIRFNLMAVIQDRRQVYTQQLEKQQAAAERVRTKLESLASAIPEGTATATATSMDTQDGPEEGETLPSDEGQLQDVLADCEGSIQRLQDALADEQDKRRHWHEENIRRKHNFIPFLFNLLKLLGEQKQLGPLIEDAAKPKGEGARGGGAAPMVH